MDGGGDSQNLPSLGPWGSGMQSVFDNRQEGGRERLDNGGFKKGQAHAGKQTVWFNSGFCTCSGLCSRQDQDVGGGEFHSSS